MLKDTPSYFLAGAGGVIGLFTGMSILSLAELAYWVLKTVTYPCKARRRKGRQEEEEEEEEEKDPEEGLPAKFRMEA